jgi:superfamily II DNA/RNA helicase
VLGRVKALVLDEADEMLDLGFLPDVERIMRMLPEQRHTMLFSATMPGPIIALSRAFLNRPTHIRAEEADQGSIHERTTQLVYRAHAMDKVELLTRVLQAKDRGLTMIFARTKRTVQRVADDLAERGFAAPPCTATWARAPASRRCARSAPGKVDVLVATDVAARGIDVTDVTHVVNYQCPEDAKTYVHRIGRTGRAGKTGVAVTLVDWDELHGGRRSATTSASDMPEAPETYSTSAHLYTDLDIPRPRPDACRGQAHPRRPGRRVRRHRGRPRRTSPEAPRPQRLPRRPTRRVRPGQRRSRARSRAGVLLGIGRRACRRRADRRSTRASDRGAGARRGHRSGDDAGEATPRRRRRRGGTRRRRWPVTPSPRLSVRRRDGRRGELRPVRWISGSGYASGVVLRAAAGAPCRLRAGSTWTSADAAPAASRRRAAAVRWTSSLHRF